MCIWNIGANSCLRRRRYCKPFWHILSRQFANAHAQISETSFMAADDISIIHFFKRNYLDYLI